MLKETHRNNKDVLVKLTHNLPEQTFFVAKVVVDHIHTGMGMLADLTHRYAVEALLREKSCSGGKQSISYRRISIFVHTLFPRMLRWLNPIRGSFVRYGILPIITNAALEGCVPGRQFLADGVWVGLLEKVLTWAQVNDLEVRQVLSAPSDLGGLDGNPVVTV